VPVAFPFQERKQQAVVEAQCPVQVALLKAPNKPQEVAEVPT